MVFNIGDVFLQWQMAGIFEFLLPALLIFAIVFGILNTTGIITKEKNIQVIIALVIALISIGYTSSMNFSLGQFLMEMFPRLGVGLAVLLGLLILVGLFINNDEKKYWNYGLAAIGVIIAIVIFSKSFERFGWIDGGYSGDYVGWIVGAVLMIGLIIAVAASGGEKKPKEKGS